MTDDDEIFCSSSAGREIILAYLPGTPYALGWDKFKAKFFFYSSTPAVSPFEQFLHGHFIDRNFSEGEL